jgi:hypothetical protein
MKANEVRLAKPEVCTKHRKYRVTIKGVDTFNVVLKRNCLRFNQYIYMVLYYMFLSSYDEVTNVLCLSLLSHDRYQYDSLILSEQT